MTRILPLIIILICCLSANAQTPLSKQPSDKTPVAMKNFATPDALPAMPFKPQNPVFGQKEKVVGTCLYDLQTYASLGQRIVDFGGGKAAGIWQFSNTQAGGWTDRGAAYNNYDGVNWGAAPTRRVESVRTGFPTYAAAANGREFILSHNAAAGLPYVLDLYAKDAGQTSWRKLSTVPTAFPAGMVWPKIATGGPDGNSLHVVAVTLAPNFGGDLLNAVNQHPLYYRSADGGVTWDKKDIIIPGLDSSKYNTVAAEGYAIDARGNTVAVAVFESWGDLAIFKSTDNGISWTKTIVKDFPVDKMDDAIGYDAGDLPVDPDAPTDRAILTADGSGALVIDNNGKVHIAFGWMYVELDPGVGRAYYPTMNGLAYWNEDMAPENFVLIGAALDYDNNSQLDLANANVANYGSHSLSSQPTMGVDANNHLFVVYSAVREDYQHPDTELNYRQLYVVKSTDGGATWSDPFELINDKTATEPVFIPATEGVFPAVPLRIGNTLHVLYQQDFNPGMAAFPDEYEASENLFMHLELNKNTFDPVSTGTHDFALSGNVSIAPNPATDAVFLHFDLQKETEVRAELTDLTGKTVWNKQLQLPSGKWRDRVDVEGLSEGLYFLRFETDGVSRTEKLMIRAR